MKKRFMQFAAILLTVALSIPPSGAIRSNDEGQTMIRVGLASSSSHNALGETASAHLQNNTGYGEGFRFGYYDSKLNFIELARTSPDITAIAVLKTQNLYYGHDSALGKTTYSDGITSNIAVGCYHVQLPDSYDTYESAAEAASQSNGFVAWIDGAYQVRVGAYVNRDEAVSTQEALGLGTIVGTSSYGMSVVKTGTNQVLFQFDCGADQALGVLPDVTGAEDVRTWFSDYKYRGGFTYQRVSGGNLTVVNVLELDDYVKGVICYEMGRTWPLEALKTQAICARSYALRRLNTHNSLGFDLCNSDSCQVYRGAGTKRTDYGPSEVSDQAVEETAGEVLWYNGKLVDAVFSSSHGGASEDAKNIWGTDTVNDAPYLQGVIDPYEQDVDDRNPYSPWTVTYTADQLIQRLRSYGFGANTSVDHLELTYSKMGNVIEAKVCFTNGKSKTITSRSRPGIRSVFGLNSIRFTVNGQTVTPGTKTETEPSDGYAVNQSDTLDSLEDSYTISGDGAVAPMKDDLYVLDGNGKAVVLEPTSSGSTSNGSNEGGGKVTVSGSSYVFNGRGWGHSVGMSQFGANAMARRGFTYDQICAFYYPGTTLDLYQ